MLYIHTDNLYIDIDTQGHQLITASGHNYSSPTATPEPSTAALLITAFLTLSLGRLRKQRRGRQV